MVMTPKSEPVRRCVGVENPCHMAAAVGSEYCAGHRDQARKRQEEDEGRQDGSGVTHTIATRCAWVWAKKRCAEPSIAGSRFCQPHGETKRAKLAEPSVAPKAADQKRPVEPVNAIPDTDGDQFKVEAFALGTILLDNHLMQSALETLPASAWLRESHQVIFAAMVELKERGDIIDQITLCELLRERGDLEKVGGAAYIAHLVASIPEGVTPPGDRPVRALQAIDAAIGEVEDDLAALRIARVAIARRVSL